MQGSDEKFCLQWNEFRDNLSSAFTSLRDDIEFTDVTLACEDGQQVEVHKVVLISSSPFFLNLLKRNKHPHPLVYMRDVTHEDLVSLVDFLYLGEANVFQANLDSFLAMADELQLKGLKREWDVESVLQNKQTSQRSGKRTKDQVFPSKDKTRPKGFEDEVVIMSPVTETAIVALDENFPASTDLEELDQKVKSMMKFSENKAKGTEKVRLRICTVCGREGVMTLIMKHIEANHITDISIPCNICGKNHKTRAALSMHSRKYHCQSL